MKTKIKITIKDFEEALTALKNLQIISDYIFNECCPSDCEYCPIEKYCVQIHKNIRKLDKQIEKEIRKYDP